jgi:deoxyribonuclease-2
MFLVSFLLAAAAAAATTATTAATLSCRDEAGAPVDSWQAFKYNKGTKYLYSDTNSPSPSVSQHSMNDTTVGALAHTTKQLWDASISYIAYNDEPPTANGGQPEMTPGHTKGYGAVAADGSAFLVIHSIPKFPTTPSNASEYIGMEPNAWMYGQSALCLTLNATSLANMLVQMQLNAPQVYDWRTGASSADAAIAALGTGVVNTAPNCQPTVYETQGRAPFTYFAKSKQWGNDLYSECVAPYYNSPLLVESWIRGSAIGPSCSSPEQVLDIQALNYDGFVLSEYNDHSKWAVSSDQDSAIVCIGDINRMTTQYGRGGGTACLETLPLAEFLRAAITSTNSCS